MKCINKILLAAVAVSFALANSARADDQAFLSPRARQNQTRVSSGANNTDPDLVKQTAALSGTPRMKIQHRATMVAGNTSSDPDLVKATAALSGTPRMKTQQPVMQQFEIAPLKNK
jgi:hypothetical protein